jgi:DNA-binding MarR family transcriptional regulator
MDKLIDLLREVSGSFQSCLHELPSLHDLKLAPFQGRLLAIVGRRPGCSQQELAGWMDRNKAQIARTIKELESRGLLTRSAQKSDWRSYSVTLTVEGKRACALLMQERAALAAAVTAELSTEERHVMTGVLNKMKRRLNDRIIAGREEIE